MRRSTRRARRSSPPPLSPPTNNSLTGANLAWIVVLAWVALVWCVERVLAILHDYPPRSPASTTAPGSNSPQADTDRRGSNPPQANTDRPGPDQPQKSPLTGASSSGTVIKMLHLTKKGKEKEKAKTDGADREDE